MKIYNHDISEEQAKKILDFLLQKTGMNVKLFVANNILKVKNSANCVANCAYLVNNYISWIQVFCSKCNENSYILQKIIELSQEGFDVIFTCNFAVYKILQRNTSLEELLIESDLVDVYE